MSDEPRTALGSAHDRFLRSLPDRGRELRDLVRRLQSAPADERLVEQIGRRLHALYASAQVFQAQALLDAIRISLGGMETARLERRPPTPNELDATLALCAFLGDESDAGSDAPARPAPASRSGRGSEPGPPPSWNDGLAGGSGPTRRPSRASISLHELDAPSEQPVSIPHTVAGALSSPDVIAVLALAGAEVASAVRAALPEDRCQITTSAEPDTALAVIDEVAPDVVVLDTSRIVGDPAELVRKLRGARAGAVRAVVAIVPEQASDVEALLGRAHVDGVLRLPLPRSGLLERFLRWCGRGARRGGGIEWLASGTVDEIARGVAEEIRRGITGSLRLGRSERIELGDKAELLAAAWSAVSRIRAHLADRADGRVRFDEAPYAGGPAALALTELEAAEPYLGLSDALRGKRILLADDDPAVLWFFAGLLREAGAIAIEARNGREALEHARRRPPDVVISDILMPEIDGFTLCRELKRDLILAHVPVILISWKEDFLQRMRELDAGAVGYLRKEAGSHQILATVAEALRPRTELAGLLAAGGEVSGRIEPLGVPVLLQTVAALRPDARVTVHDAWNLFDVDVRNGATLAVTRTASDGSFARGHSALRQLLGVDSGRFTVEIASGRPRNPLAEPLAELIADALRQLAALLDAVSDSRLMRAHRVALDDEVLSSLLTATPTGLADVAARLRVGEPARELVASGAVTARDLEQHLRELARRGAVLGVFGEGGEDLVAAARTAREQAPGTLLHAGERLRNSPLPTMLAENDVEWVEAPPTSPDALSPEERAVAIAASVVVSNELPAPTPVSAVEPAAAADAQEPQARARHSTTPFPTALEPMPDSGIVPALRDGAMSVSPATDVAPTTAVVEPALRAETAVEPRVQPREQASQETADSAMSEPRPRRHAVALGPELAPAQAKTEPFTVRSNLLQEETKPRASQTAPNRTADDRDGDWLKLALVLAALMFVGFVSFRALSARGPGDDARSSAVRVRVPAASPTPAAPASTPAAGPAPTVAGASAPPPVQGASPELAVADTGPGFGRVLPFIDRSRGVSVAPDQGLLVVEYEAAGAPPRVRVAGRDLGAAPIATALPAGRHEIVLKRDEQTSFRMVVIRAGETRIVQIRE